VGLYALSQPWPHHSVSDCFFGARSARMIDALMLPVDDINILLFSVNTAVRSILVNLYLYDPFLLILSLVVCPYFSFLQCREFA
jgi:hypothetical protein